MNDFADFSLYVVRNKEGKFFRSKGRDGRGESWVASLATAKVYAKIGPAKAVVSFFANHYPKYGVPEILKLKVAEVEVIDETERVKKVQEKRKRAKQKAEKRTAEYRLKNAAAELETAKKRYDEAKNEI